MRYLKTGATRSSNHNKYEYARFLDSRVLKSFAKYMTKHRTQEDGKLREPDNWKKGMDKQVWIDSLARHFWDVWEIHQHGEAIRPENGEKVDLEEALDGLLFNVMGYLFETLNEENTPKKK